MKVYTKYTQSLHKVYTKLLRKPHLLFQKLPKKPYPDPPNPKHIVSKAYESIRKAYESIRKAYESIRKAYESIRKAYPPPFWGVSGWGFVYTCVGFVYTLCRLYMVITCGKSGV